jgi:hypothetical protein
MSLYWGTLKSSRICRKIDFEESVKLQYVSVWKKRKRHRSGRACAKESTWHEDEKHVFVSGGVKKPKPEGKAGGQAHRGNLSCDVYVR